ncbi:hypothetical protein ACIBEJ_34315 [Nonomuraea sp. NPDC050790]|uniref:hypothetical protein n=1 Tax=Nonomuraea sp. NPDC050790 TaxID=3364371 RepID=UPI00379DACE1
MTTTSRAPAVIDALVALCRAAPALDGVAVHDGPHVTSSPLKAVVCIGWDGDEDNDAAVEAQQEWASIGQKAKNETLQVTCAAVAWNGGTVTKTARDRAYALVGAVEDALRSDPALGFPPPTIVAMTTGNAFQRQDAGGVQCRVVFTVAVHTRI